MDNLVVQLPKHFQAFLRYQKVLDTERGDLVRKMKETNTIFVHIPKTGGKSVLASLYGVDVHKGCGHAEFPYYASLFGPINVKTYFKFAFVRNPWDRLYSSFSFAKRGGFGFEQDKLLFQKIEGFDFKQFVLDWLSPDKLNKWTILKPQYSFICDKNHSVLVDRVCRFEHMEEEYDALTSRFEAAAPLLHLNKATTERAYLSHYDSDMKKAVGKLYTDDIQIFDYSFESKD